MSVSSREPGFLEPELASPETKIVSLVERSLSHEERREIAHACDVLIRYSVGEELPRAVRAVLGLMRKTYSEQLRQRLDQREADEIRGRMDGLDRSEAGLTDLETLSKLRREMLGITDDPDSGA